MSVFDWDLNPDNNQKSDPDINWREGQPPSSVNNSARAMMAAFAAWLKDSSGPVNAGGSANALVITLSDLPVTEAAGIFAFEVAQQNTGATTLAFKRRDGSTGTAYPLRTKFGADIGAGTLRPGIPYLATLRTPENTVYLLNAALSLDETNAAISAGMQAAIQTAESYALTQANSARDDAVAYALAQANSARDDAVAYALAQANSARSDAEAHADTAAGNAQNAAIAYTNSNAWLKNQHGQPVETLRRINGGTLSTPPNSTQRAPGGAFLEGYDVNNVAPITFYYSWHQYYRQDVGWVTITG